MEHSTRRRRIDASFDNVAESFYGKIVSFWFNDKMKWSM